MPELCETCRWWQALDPIDGVAERGECRRRAPHAMTLPDKWGAEPYRVLWPLTLDSDWCGEWAPAKVVQGKGGVG